MKRRVKITSWIQNWNKLTKDNLERRTKSESEEIEKEEDKDKDKDYENDDEKGKVEEE